jgi:hypothetical protein
MSTDTIPLAGKILIGWGILSNTTGRYLTPCFDETTVALAALVIVRRQDARDLAQALSRSPFERKPIAWRAEPIYRDATPEDRDLAAYRIALEAAQTEAREAVREREQADRYLKRAHATIATRDVQISQLSADVAALASERDKARESLIADTERHARNLSELRDERDAARRDLTLARDQVTTLDLRWVIVLADGGYWGHRRGAVAEVRGAHWYTSLAEARTSADGLAPHDRNIAAVPLAILRVAAKAETARAVLSA